MGKSYSHLNSSERAVIQLGLEQGCSLRSIARSLDRSVSTISRELSRNNWENPAYRVGRRGRRPIAGGYHAGTADQRAQTLATKARKQRKLVPGNALWDDVVDLLRSGASPEQASGILKRMHPDDISYQVSHETVYTAIYAMPRGEQTLQQPFNFVIITRIFGGGGYMFALSAHTIESRLGKGRYLVKIYHLLDWREPRSKYQACCTSILKPLLLSVYCPFSNGMDRLRR